MRKNIICFGDSNTHGYDSETGGRFDELRRWPCILQALLGEEYHVLEEGLSGRTTVFEDPLFEGLSGLNAVHGCLMTHEPVDLLIIMLGTNDTKERFGCNARNIGRGMERLALKALSCNDAWRNRPNLLIVAPAPIENGYEATDVRQEMGRGCVEKSRELTHWYRETARSLGCHFMDAGELGLSMHPADCMHLDAGSHRKLAEALSRIVLEII